MTSRGGFDDPFARPGGSALQDVLSEDDAPVSAAAAVDVDLVWREAHVQQLLDDLDRELVGLGPVKTRIREIAALLLVTRLRDAHGLSTERPTLHMSFTGRPGTGKTSVAMRMAQILHQLGYLRKGHVVVATRDDLVGQYIGHTAPKTREIVKRALGGVLFIDEAYYLYRAENERDYGQETIEMLLQVMESQRDDLVVILAGYRERMEVFFQANPGFRSRVAHHIDFADYGLDELIQIAELMVRQQQYAFDGASRAAFADYLRRRMAQPHFANGRSVRNAIDRIKLRHANRLLRAGGRIVRDELARIDEADVRQSRVFTAEPAQPTATPDGGRA
jgi:probable Rubsico expression protein CbbX